jgi:hypothetical protein
MSTAISFPFERSRFYPVSELTDFLDVVTKARGRDPELDAALHVRKLPWAKVFLEELLPIGLLAQQNRVPGDAQFRFMAEGNAVDGEVWFADGAIRRFRITLAYPDWDGGSGEPRNPGYIASLEREGIKQGNPVFLGGLIARSVTGQIESHPAARDNQVDRTACEMGLRKALRTKLAKAATYTGRVDILLVYASRLRFHLDFAETSSVVTPIVAAELARIGDSPFRQIVVIDDDPLGYVEFPAQANHQA